MHRSSVPTIFSRVGTTSKANGPVGQAEHRSWIEKSNRVNFFIFERQNWPLSSAQKNILIVTQAKLIEGGSVKAVLHYQGGIDTSQSFNLRYQSK